MRCSTNSHNKMIKNPLQKLSFQRGVYGVSSKFLIRKKKIFLQKTIDAIMIGYCGNPANVQTFYVHKQNNVIYK